MSIERRVAPGRRVEFQHALTANIMGIDGTWKAECDVSDVSDTGARIVIGNQMKAQQLQEFFLIFPGNGLVFRRCEMRWVKGDNIGVHFIKEGSKKKRQIGSQAHKENAANHPI